MDCRPRRAAQTCFGLGCCMRHPRVFAPSPHQRKATYLEGSSCFIPSAWMKGWASASMAASASQTRQGGVTRFRRWVARVTHRGQGAARTCTIQAAPCPSHRHSMRLWCCFWVRFLCVPLTEDDDRRLDGVCGRRHFVFLVAGRCPVCCMCFHRNGGQRSGVSRGCS